MQTMRSGAALFVQEMDLNPLHIMKTCFDEGSVGYAIGARLKSERFPLQQTATASSRGLLHEEQLLPPRVKQPLQTQNSAF